MAKIVLAANSGWNIVNYRSGLVRALIAEGHDVVVVAPEGPHSQAIRDLGAGFEPLAMQARGTSPLADLLLLARFRRLLGRLRPAAFLGFTAKPNIWGAMAARSLGIPVFANISGLGAVFAHGGPLMRVMVALYRRALAPPATIIFQNIDDRALFAEMGIGAPDHALLVPGSGVDLDHFAPRPNTAEGDACRFLFAGRLLWAKGVGDFVEAGAALREAGHDVAIDILGIVEPEGPTAVPRSALDAWQNGGEANYLGAASDVRIAIADHDCIVLPSRYREGVPHILLEAGAMGRPVITTETPGCREAVEDGVTGFTCQSGSLDSLIVAMQRMADLDRSRRMVMGRAGRELMERRFGQQLVHRTYIDALRKHAFSEA